MNFATHGFGKQLVVGHVKKHTSQVKSRREMKDNETFTAKGNAKADEIANVAAGLDTASRTEWLTSEMQEERGKVKHSIAYQVHVHENGRLNDTQSLEETLSSPSSFFSLLPLPPHHLHPTTPLPPYPTHAPTTASPPPLPSSSSILPPSSVSPPTPSPPSPPLLLPTPESSP